MDFFETPILGGRDAFIMKKTTNEILQTYQEVGDTPGSQRLFNLKRRQRNRKLEEELKSMKNKCADLHSELSNREQRLKKLEADFKSALEQIQQTTNCTVQKSTR